MHDARHTRKRAAGKTPDAYMMNEQHLRVGEALRNHVSAHSYDNSVAQQSRDAAAISVFLRYCVCAFLRFWVPAFLCLYVFVSYESVSLRVNVLISLCSLVFAFLRQSISASRCIDVNRLCASVRLCVSVWACARLGVPVWLCVRMSVCLCNCVPVCASLRICKTVFVCLCVCVAVCMCV